MIKSKDKKKTPTANQLITIWFYNVAAKLPEEIISAGYYPDIFIPQQMFSKVT